LSEDVCGQCNSNFSALDTKLIEFVRKIAYLGHPDVSPDMRLLTGKIGLKLDAATNLWQTVRVENGQPVVFPQLICAGPGHFQFVLDGTDLDEARNDVEKIIIELADPRRLELERMLVDVPESQPAIVRSTAFTYMLRAPTDEQIDELDSAIRSGGLASSLRTGKTDSPTPGLSQDQIHFRLKWDFSFIERAVAKSSLNFVCAALGADIARLPVFDAVRDFVRDAKGQGYVRPLLGDEAESARSNPGFLCKPGHHAMLFCGGIEPPVVAVSLYARPFAIVRVATARFTSPASNVVALFDYKNKTHEIVAAERHPLEFLRLFTSLRTTADASIHR
jgi:DNA-binding transcriptional ArsR family regulator